MGTTKTTSAHLVWTGYAGLATARGTARHWRGAMAELESLLPAVEIIAGRVWKKYGLTLSGFMEFDDLYQQ